jgi:hypothetical protein
MVRRLMITIVEDPLKPSIGARNLLELTFETNN